MKYHPHNVGHTLSTCPHSALSLVSPICQDHLVDNKQSLPDMLWLTCGSNFGHPLTSNQLGHKWTVPDGQLCRTQSNPAVVWTSPALEHSVMSPASQWTGHPNSSSSLKTSLSAANVDAILLLTRDTINLVPYGNQTFRSCHHLNTKNHLVANILVELLAWHNYQQGRTLIWCSSSPARLPAIKIGAHSNIELKGNQSKTL